MFPQLNLVRAGDSVVRQAEVQLCTQEEADAGRQGLVTRRKQHLHVCQ